MNRHTVCSSEVGSFEYWAFPLTRMFHDSVSRDREDERATGQPQGLEPEEYLDSTRDPRTPGRTVISAVEAAES